MVSLARRERNAPPPLSGEGGHPIDPPQGTSNGELCVAGPALTVM